MGLGKPVHYRSKGLNLHLTAILRHNTKTILPIGYKEVIRDGEGSAHITVDCPLYANTTLDASTTNPY